MMKLSSIFLLTNISVDSAVSTVNGPSFITKILSYIVEFSYSVVKWLMYATDVIFFYVKQLCGLEMDLTSASTALSKDSDMVFNFILSNTGNIFNIIRSLIGVAIVMIIVFSIIAIVKNSLNSIKSDKPLGLGDVGRTAAKSILMLVVVPIFSVMAIVACNVILKALYNATNVYNSNSLSSSLFSASATPANKYREYALANQRIPVYMNFEMQMEIIEKYQEEEDFESLWTYVNSDKNIMDDTHDKLANNSFMTFDELSSASNLSSYYQVYDHDPSQDNGVNFNAYRSEYFVMADVIDYAVSSNQTLYIKTIEDVIQSAQSAGYYSNLRDTYDIQVGSKITFKSNYYDANEDGEPNAKKQISYEHVIGATDELEGAVFIVAVEKVTESGIIYYAPLTNNFLGRNDAQFSSDYIMKGQIIVAKGLFDNNGYPTAIRKSQNGKNIIFYRDNMELVTLGKVDTAYTQEPVEVDENGGITGFFSKIINWFKKKLNPLNSALFMQFKPKTNITSYVKTTEEINNLTDGGKLHLSYMFSDWLTGKLMKDNVGLELKNLYNPSSINFLVLCVGSVMLLKTMCTAVFALIKRMYELVVLIICYPMVCGMIPIDDGAAVGDWISNYKRRLFMTYGLILGLNFVLMLFPVIESIEFFTLAEVSTTKYVRRIGKLFFGLFSLSTITNMLNLITAILFELVAISMISKDASSKIGAIVGADGDMAKNNPFGDIMKAIGTVTDVLGKIISAFGLMVSPLTSKGRQKIKAEFKKKATAAIPLNSAVDEAKDKVNLMKKKQAQKEAERDLMESLDSNSSSPAEVQQKLQAYQNAQKSYSKALEDPRGDRQAEDSVKKDQKKSGVSSRADDDLSQNGVDESQKSTNEVESDMKDASKKVKYLEKKKKQGGELSDEEEASLKTYTEIRDQAKKVLDDRKNEEEENDANKKELENLKKREDAGLLSADESARKAELEQKQEAYKQLLQQRAKYDKQVQKNLTVKHKMQKQDIKMAKQQREDFYKFRNAKGGRAQKKRLEELEKNEADTEEAFLRTGANVSGGSLSNMKTADINKMIADNGNTNQFTEQQIEILKSYAQQRAYREQLTNITMAEHQAYEEQKIVQQQKKDKNTIRSRNAIKRGIVSASRKRNASHSGEDEAKLQNIDAQIQQLGEVNSSNIAKRKKLMQERAKIQARMTTSQNFVSANTKENRKQLRSDRRKGRKTAYRHNQLREMAIDELSERGEFITEQKINKIINDYNYAHSPEGKRKAKEARRNRNK